ncbi:MAG: MerR family DNA-binding protein [Mariprofundaceae bacterium]|nr:MerR family DNA-binding protein [Mariprofundaceae bacterium]
MKIGELSRQAAVSIDTIRYYEQRELIPEPMRTPSGYRQYSTEDVKRLKFIAQAKELGFTLKETGQLLSLHTDACNCAEVRAVAEAKANEIEVRIRKLSQMRQVLLTLAKQCEQSSDTDPCPILKSLEDNLE